MPAGIPAPPHATLPRSPRVDAARTTRGKKPVKTIEDVQWTYTPQSSWVVAFRYLAAKLLMQIWFKSGAVCQYSNIGPNIANNFRRVGSKGKAVWRSFYYLPYKLVKRGGKRRRR